MSDDELKSNRARVVEATEDDAAPDGEAVAGSRIGNFVFHHKIALIVAAAVVFLAVFSLCMFFSPGQNADVEMIYAGPCALTANDGEQIAAAILSAQGDAAKTVSIADYMWFSDYDLKNPPKTAQLVSFDAAENQSELDRFRMDLGNGSALLLFISPQLESQIKTTLVPLSEIFGDDLPESSIEDDFAVRLGDTAFYEAFPAVRDLPQNTRVCVRRASEASAVGDTERGRALEADAKAIVRAIALYEGADGTD